MRKYESAIVEASVRKCEYESVRMKAAYSTADVDRWLARAQVRKTKNGKPYVRTSQFNVLKKACDRVKQELLEEAGHAPRSDPLLWLMHGGPGVGKSEVVKLLKDFLRTYVGLIWVSNSKWQPYRP